MDDLRTKHVERIQAPITEDAYRVDPEAVAQALLRRLLEGRALPPGRR